MKTFIQTITVFVALSLAMTGSTPAQNAPKEALQARPAIILLAEAKKTPSVPEPLPAPSALPEPFLPEPPASPEPFLPEPPAPPEPPSSIAFIASEWPRQYTGSGLVLVIPTAQMKPQDLADITQDLNVMSRILDKKLGRPTRISAISEILLFSGDSQATEALYLEGFGALFLVKVKFPLAPPPQVQQEKDQEDADPLWTQTKQEIYTPEDAEMFAGPMGDRLPEEYDAEKVENLKQTLIKTLKHAANIRNLGPDDLVTIVVSGSQPGITVKHIRAFSRSELVTLQTPPSLSEMTSPRPTFLTIRAKKSDIDAFSKDQLDYDQFRKRTQIYTY